MSNAFDVTVGTVYDLAYGGGTNPRYGLITLTSTTLQWAEVDSTATPSSMDDALKFTKR